MFVMMSLAIIVII